MDHNSIKRDENRIEKLGFRSAGRRGPGQRSCLAIDDRRPKRGLGSSKQTMLSTFAAASLSYFTRQSTLMSDSGTLGCRGCRKGRVLSISLVSNG